MLADGCEAWARADRPKTEADVEKLVQTVIDDRQAAGQLDDTGLTVRDLALIRESFVATLRGVFHPRIEYPKDSKPALPSPPAPSPAALPPARPVQPPPEQQPRSAN
jgi:membrane-associated HD superfamily phosphohydrolase